MVVILFFMLVRWSWPRFRFDQLMALAWKVMLPLGIVNLTGLAILFELEHLEMIPALARVAVSWILAVASLVLVAVSGPLISDNRPRLEVGS